MRLALPACLLAALCSTMLVSAGNSDSVNLMNFGSSSFRGSLFGIQDQKIVGGKTTSIMKHPYMVSIEEYYDWAPKWFHKCGGTILNHFNILSAAHCFQDEPEAPYRVRAGSTKRGKGGVVINVTDVFYHPKFTPEAIDYDVAIFRLAKSLQYNTFSIKPISLPKIGSSVRTGATFQIIGWGAEQTMAFEYPHFLQQAAVSVVAPATCARDYMGVRPVTKRMICAEGPGKDSCTGDSGGPLLSVAKGRSDIQVGIVSWGEVCAAADQPGVYTNLADADIRAYIAQALKKK